MSKLSLQFAELVEKGEEETAYEKYVSDGLEIDGCHRERPCVPMSQVRLFPLTYQNGRQSNALALANLIWKKPKRAG